MKYLNSVADALIALVAVYAVVILMSLITTYDQPYDCFDSTAGRELADGSKSLFGSFVEATNCEYDDHLSQHTCDQGVYKYCYEGGNIVYAPSDKEYAPVHTQGDETL